MKYESYGVIVIKEVLPLFPNAHLKKENRNKTSVFKPYPIIIKISSF